MIHISCFLTDAFVLKLRFAFYAAFMMFITISLSTGHGWANRISGDKDRISGVGKTEKLTFLSVKDGKIVNTGGVEIYLRGFHYDCVYVLNKSHFDSLLESGSDPDLWNQAFSEAYFSTSDVKKLKNLGANVVRIEMRLWEIERTPFVYSNKYFDLLDATIKMFGDEGIYTILDMHSAGQNSLSHNKEYGNIIWRDEKIQKRVIDCWGAIAKRYENNPFVAGYDIINEPQAPDVVSLKSFYQSTIGMIRRFDKRHIIILAANMSDDTQSPWGGQYSDNNIVLSIHFYRPAKFTHQGKRGNPGGVKYPGQYGATYWDKHQIASYFDKAIAAGRKPMRPIFVGEFSANLITGGEDALQWIDDVINVMLERDIHFTYFCYKFPMRETFAYLSPKAEIMIRMRALQKAILDNDIGLTTPTEEQKSLFVTSNFEYSKELEKILEKGFKYPSKK